MSDSPADQNQESRPGPTLPLPANFVETDTPEISVPELMARVQEEVARRKADSSVANSSDQVGFYLGTGRRSRSSLDWSLITFNLSVAEKNAFVGHHVPHMRRFPGPIRVVARSLGSGFLYLLRMITNPQREFNLAVLIVLRALRDGIRQLDKAHQQALSDLKERQLEEIRKTLQDHQRRLDLLLDETRRKAG